MDGNVGLESTPDIGSEFYFVLPLEPVDHHPEDEKELSQDSDEETERMETPPESIPLLTAKTTHPHTKPDLLSNFSSPTVAISPYPVLEVSVIKKILADLDSPDKQFRVLCVEDNRLNQALVCRMMQKLKYVYEVADNGQEAVDIYTNANTANNVGQKDAFDVILMDLQMPICDGFEATRQILNFQKQTFGSAVFVAPIIAVTAQAMSGDREICLSKGMKGYVSKPIDFQLLRQLLEGIQCQKLLAEKEGSPSM
jgi:CheY-like chemotaxis protein